MDDKRIVTLFLERSEQAIEAVDRKYGKLCQQIARGIVDSQEAALKESGDVLLSGVSLLLLLMSDCPHPDPRVSLIPPSLWPAPDLRNSHLFVG